MVDEDERETKRRSGREGGLVRADRLTPHERSEIARRAAGARWGVSLIPATHTGDLQIGERTIACAVLEDGTRVINQTTLLAALGRASARGRISASGLFSPNMQPYIPLKLSKALSEPIAYSLDRGGRARGYPAELLPDICEVFLTARAAEALTPSQEPLAEAAEILMRGFARLGIVALVDEATGYQEVRARSELQRLLEAYVQAELRPWVKMFPDEFFRGVYKIHGWEFKPGTTKRTPAVGRIINKFIYGQLPPGVLEELRRKNARGAGGHRPYKHHQFLTEITGIPHLDKHISTVTTLLRIARDKADFEDLFERAFPPAQQRLPLIIDLDGDTEADTA